MLQACCMQANAAGIEEKLDQLCGRRAHMQECWPRCWHWMAMYRILGGQGT